MCSGLPTVRFDRITHHYYVERAYDVDAFEKDVVLATIIRSF